MSSVRALRSHRLCWLVRDCATLAIKFVRDVHHNFNPKNTDYNNSVVHQELSDHDDNGLPALQATFCSASTQSTRQETYRDSKNSRRSAITRQRMCRMLRHWLKRRTRHCTAHRAETATSLWHNLPVSPRTTNRAMRTTMPVTSAVVTTTSRR